MAEKLRRLLVFLGLIEGTEEDHLRGCPWCRAAIKREEALRAKEGEKR